MTSQPLPGHDNLKSLRLLGHMETMLLPGKQVSGLQPGPSL